jgi:adenylylsulfate kinase
LFLAIFEKYKNKMIIQFCGLSGSGKTTLAGNVKELLQQKNINVEVIDGDEYRKVLCADLGFSKAHRNQNIRRLAFVASKLAQYDVIPIICAINPYNDIREEISASYENVKTVFIDCNLDMLIQRDTKGLYKKALLPEGHADRITNFTGVNDPFEIPVNVDLVIHSDTETVEESTEKLVRFILSHRDTFGDNR